MTELTRRAVIAGGLTSLVTLPARSETVWPTRPITLMHGYAPGGPVDTVARIVAEGLSRRLGQPVVVDSKPAQLARSRQRKWPAPHRTAIRSWPYRVRTRPPPLFTKSCHIGPSTTSQ